MAASKNDYTDIENVFLPTVDDDETPILLKTSGR